MTHYAGFDWAHDHHDVVIVDRSGQIVADFEIKHNAQAGSVGVSKSPRWDPD